MRKLRLANPLVHHALGLYLDRGECWWTTASKTPFGIRPGATKQECGEGEAQWAIVERLLTEHVTAHGSAAPVNIALSLKRTFLATVPLASEQDTAVALLAGQANSSISPRDLEAELLRFKIGSRSFGTLCACWKSDLEPLMKVAGRLGLTGIRVEPAPFALLRSDGGKGRRGANSAGLILRLFIWPGRTVAVLARGDQPLLWRSLDLSASDPQAERSALISAVRGLGFHAQQHLESAMDAVVVEGGEMARQVMEGLVHAAGRRVSFTSGSASLGAAISRGLALGAWPGRSATVELGRTLRPPAPLWQLVPRGEAAVLAAVVLSGAAWLWMNLAAVEQKTQWVEQVQQKHRDLARRSDGDLEKLDRDLLAEVQAVQRFTASRMLWSDLLNQLAERLPADVGLVSLWGEQELAGEKAGAAKKIKQRVLLDMVSSFPIGVSAPPELDRVVLAVQKTPAVADRFPDVKLASLRRDPNRPRGAVVDTAKFSVLCLPKVRKAAVKSPKEGEGSADTQQGG